MCDWGFTEEKRQSGRALRVLCGKAGAWDRQIAQFSWWAGSQPERQGCQCWLPGRQLCRTAAQAAGILPPTAG